MRKLLEQCPSCGAQLEITRLSCTSCETIVLGRYQPCPFCKLDPENTHFLLTFVKCRGNVKEMERELGISYWTIRRKLDELVEALGMEASQPEKADTTAQELEILEKVNRGELGVTEASDILARLKGSES
jgi:hypothetical protein